MTILLSGNSITPAQLTAGTKVAKATAGLPNSVDAYAGQQSVPLEADEDAPFTLAPYLGQLVEDVESTSLPETALLSEELPRHLSASDTHPMLQSEMATKTGGSLLLAEPLTVSANTGVDFSSSAALTADIELGLPLATELPTVSANTGVDFSSSATLTADIELGLPLAESRVAQLLEGAMPVEQLIASSPQELPAVTQSITTPSVSDVDTALITEPETEPGILLDSVITPLFPELVVGILDDNVELTVENLQMLSADQLMLLVDTPTLNSRQIEPAVFTTKLANSGQLAPATPVLASLQSANNIKPLTLSDRGAHVGASSSAMPVFTAITDELVKGNTLSSATMQLSTPRMGLADNSSLQQFLHQQSVAISPASSSPFSITPGPSSSSTTTLPQWQSLSLSGAPASWGPKLFAVLSDKVVLQMGQQVQRAQIRLDPPQLGNIELRIAVEGEKTTIQLFATNPQVREAMQQTLDLLRLNLGQQLGTTNMVDVQLGDQAQQQRAFFADEVAVSQQAELVTTEQQLDSTQQQQLGWLNRLA